MTDNVVKYKSHAAGLLRQPNDAQTLVNQWALLATEGDNSKTRHYMALVERAHAIEPNFITRFNLAGAYERTGQYDRAAATYEACMPLVDTDAVPQLLHDTGVAYRGMGDNVRAIELYDAAIELAPSNPFYKRDKAISMMAGATMGTHNLVDALKAFEVRRECAEAKFKAKGTLVAQQKLPAGVVHWNDEDLTGKTVVVYHEEGSGDFIQFCRFIPKLYDLGAAFVHLTGPQPDLLDLVNDNLWTHGTVPLSGPFECDYVIGSMSLPWRVGAEYADVTGQPYFEAEPANIPLRGDLNVGLVWRGNPAYLRDNMRSMAFETLSPLFDLPEAAFYSLQVGPASAEITKLGFDGFIPDLQPFMKTWRQTARVIAALDVVVTVDTAVAHLAGALGKPVLIMVTNGCDWRWHRNTDKTAWYQSASVIRQRMQDEWEPCIEEVRQRLREMIDERSCGRGQAEHADVARQSRELTAAG